MTGLLAVLRAGAFLTHERVRLVSASLLVGYAVALAALVLGAHGLSDYQGRPLGTDFSNVYAAGVYAREGRAAAPFDPATQYREEQKLFGAATPFYGWHYPPYFLIVARALATLPYLPALLLWEIGTLGLYLGAILLLLRTTSADPVRNKGWVLLLALGFPAVFVNATHGNNGFLTAALLAAGLGFLDARPALAGVVLGLLVYKPQFALVVPLALAAGGYWRTLIAASAAAAVLSLLVTILFGPWVWSAFLASTHFARTVVLEQGGTGFHKIQSVFAWTRMWGGSIALAYALQGLTAFMAVCALLAVWRRSASAADRGALLCLAVLLATPYCLDYDLMVLAPAIALLTRQGLETSFRPYEAALLSVVWAVPLLARISGEALGFPAGTATLVTAAAYLTANALRRDATEQRQTAAPRLTQVAG